MESWGGPRELVECRMKALRDILKAVCHCWICIGKMPSAAPRRKTQTGSVRTSEEAVSAAWGELVMTRTKALQKGQSMGQARQRPYR